MGVIVRKVSRDMRDSRLHLHPVGHGKSRISLVSLRRETFILALTFIIHANELTWHVVIDIARQLR